MNNQLSKDREFSLPVSGLFIGLSLLVATLLNWLTWPSWGAMLKPDFVALILLYWCTHKPNRVGIGMAWLVGIISDVADATLFGQHALAYTVLAFGGIVLNRRIQMFDLRQQTMQVFPLLLSSYVAFGLINWQMHGFIVWQFFIGSLTTALLWTPITVALQNLRQTRHNPNEL
jgi:rod shape-determining protein MreD